MSLRNCKLLQQVPDLSSASNLTELWLDGCTNLIEIHDSVGCLNKLRELSAMRCKNLKILPSCLKLTSLKYLNLFSCSSLQRFPEISVMMEEMQTLDLEKTAITELPSSICNLIGLETLNVENCHNLEQLPACICTLPNLQQVLADLCEGMRHFKMCEGGDEASLYCSKSHMPKKSSKMERLCFSSCNLSDDSLAFCLSHFTNMIHLDLSSNSFTILPECIKEHYNLKLIWLDHCSQLKHIEGMPPNLEAFSAICCSSLTKLSKSRVLKQAFNFQPGKRNFILPGKKFPEGLHHYSRGSSVSFWVRNVLPTTFLWILVKDDHDYVYNCQVSVHINDTKLNIASKWIVQSTIKTDHIYICDMQSIILNTELPLRNKWNQVKVSLESNALKKEDGKEVYFGIHLHNLQSNSENIRFMDPRRYFMDHILLRNIQEQDCDELEKHMNLDSNPKHYQAFDPSSEPGAEEDDSGKNTVVDGHKRARREEEAEKSKKGKKGEKKEKEPRFVSVTMSEVDLPEDGYHWRKYGQKTVKNSPYPWSYYYRCTTQNCTVKKRVEGSFEDPTTVITTYEGQHNHPVPTSLRGNYNSAAMFTPSSSSTSSFSSFLSSF